MKYKNLAYIVFGALLAASCSDNEGGSPDDTELARAQRDIKQLVNTPPTGEYSIGVFYQKDTWDGSQEGQSAITTQHQRLTGKINEYNLSPQRTPVTQQDGPVKITDFINQPTAGNIAFFQSQVDACVNNGVDFLILPPIDYETGATNRLSSGDNNLCKILTGFRGMGGEETPEQGEEGAYVQLKGLKYAYTLSLNGSVSSASNWLRDGNKTVLLSYNNRIDVPGEAAEDYLQAKEAADGTKWTRMMQLKALCEAIKVKFDEPNYYKVDGQPFVLLYDPQRLYAQDSRTLYNNMREWLGGNVYLVARNGDAWCPPGRYEDFYLNGGVDAITNQPMYSGMSWGQYPIIHECIYLNWEYSRDFWWNQLGIDFIPTGQLAYNRWVRDGNTKDPQLQPDETRFRETCSIMRGLAGRSRIMLMYSLNEYRLGSFLEPTVEGGDNYLKIMKEEFNK